MEQGRNSNRGQGRKPVVTRYRIKNCLPDAFRLAAETLKARQSLYGSGSPRLGRWIEAQIRVFSHCGNQEFDPPEPPEEDWVSLETHDRHYQIAASYFYDGQYLEAKDRFAEIAATPASPWSGLSRYLAGRSLVREANADESNREAHLRQALKIFRELAQDSDFLIDHPWILGRVRYAEAQLEPVRVLNELEAEIIQTPELASVEDLRDYNYLYTYHNRKRKNTGNSADWLVVAGNRKGTAEIIARWREDRSLEWLFLALITAGSGSDEEILRKLLDAADQFGAETPGYFVMLEHRVRILGLLGDITAARALAEERHPGDLFTNLGRVNRVRLRAASLSANWEDYFRLASMRPLELPWSDLVVRSLSRQRFNHITSETGLFPTVTTNLINGYFTPRMILDVVGYKGLSDFQRGRLAISGWTKAMLMDDLDAARELSVEVKRYVPRLKAAFESFETGGDPHFEAAAIVLDNPVFSPYLWAGAGRIQDGTIPMRPAPDYIALPWNRNNWWCPQVYLSGLSNVIPAGPRFAQFEETKRKGEQEMLKAFEVSVADFFGPPVLSYAHSNPDDARLPRALHRLVFANRYSCMARPAVIAERAHSFLHKNFPNSDWARKTPSAWNLE